MIRLEVAVAAPLSQTLSYTYVPEEHPFSDPCPVGRRVLVPLGGRRITGYVLGEMPDDDVGYVLKPVAEVLDRAPLFHPNSIPFFSMDCTLLSFSHRRGDQDRSAGADRRA